MTDDLTPIGDFVSLQQPNAIGRKPILRGRKPAKRGMSKREVREVVGGFVELNAHKLQGWLEKIEEEHGALKAFEAVTSLLEFSMPKMQRREVTGADEGPVELRVTWGGKDDGGG